MNKFLHRISLAAACSLALVGVTHFGYDSHVITRDANAIATQVDKEVGPALEKMTDPILEKMGGDPILEKMGGDPILEKMGGDPILEKMGNDPILSAETVL